MIIAWLHPQAEIDPGLVASCFQQFGLELFRQKLVGLSLIDQELVEAVTRAVVDGLKG